MTSSQTSSDRDVVSRIRKQHDMIRELFDDVRDAAPAVRGERFQPLVRLLAVHETAEEMVVYPRLVSTSKEALDIVRARKREEDQAKKAQADLEGMDPSSEAFDNAFELFRAEVLAHAEREELEVLPLLERHIPSRQLKLMDKGFAAAQLAAPTHAHRMAPESALGNLLVGPFVGTVDRIRDLVRDTRAR